MSLRDVLSAEELEKLREGTTISQVEAGLPMADGNKNLRRVEKLSFYNAFI